MQNLISSIRNISVIKQINPFSESESKELIYNKKDEYMVLKVDTRQRNKFIKMQQSYNNIQILNNLYPQFVIRIEMNNNQLNQSVLTLEEFKVINVHKYLCIQGIIGIIKIEEEFQFWLISSVTEVADFLSNNIQMINETYFLPFNYIQSNQTFIQINNHQIDIRYELDIYDNQLKDLIDLITIGFYFSYDQDLTLNLNSTNDPTHTRIDFYWNYDISHPFFELNTKKSLIENQSNLINEFESIKILKLQSPIIVQGQINQFCQQSIQSNIKYLLISRRNKLRAGTRQNSRGIDDIGNVSNFIEDENILIYEKPESVQLKYIKNTQITKYQIHSYTTLRGSAPIYFTQYQHDIRHEQDISVNYGPFQKHIESLRKNYGNVRLLNTLANIKLEIPLSELYENLQLKQNESSGENGLSQSHFDYKLICKNQNSYPLINFILSKLDDFVIEHSQFKFEVSKSSGTFNFQNEWDSIIRLAAQIGIIRTNCLDCIDRTGIVNMQLAKNIINKWLKSESIDDSNPINKSIYEEFYQKFYKCWSDGADILSMFQTGANCIISQVMRNEGQSKRYSDLLVATKSTSRFIQAVSDGSKQALINLILRKREINDYLQINYNLQSSIINQELKSLEFLHSKTNPVNKLNILCLTYNIAASKQKTIDVEQLLFSKISVEQPDIICISFQEVVDLNLTNILINDDKSELFDEIAFWLKCELDKVYPNIYKLLMFKGLLGILEVVFVIDKIQPQIENLYCNEKKLGFSNILKNKGAVCISFELFKIKQLFINAHLAANIEMEDKRNESLQNLLSKFQDTNQDICFLSGDLNYRINLEQNDILSLILRKQQSSLLANDQLFKLMNINEQIQLNKIKLAFHEPEIVFQPSFKYKWENQQQILEDKRLPAQTDRVILIADEYALKKIKNVLQDVVDNVKQSDHIPVVSQFIVDYFKNEN